MQNVYLETYIGIQFYFTAFHVSIFSNYRQQIPFLSWKLLRNFWLQVPFSSNSSVCCVKKTTVHMFCEVNSIYSMWMIMQLFCREHFLWIQPNETYASYYIKYIFYNNHFNIMKTFRCLLYNLYPSFKCHLLKLIIILWKNISALLAIIALRKQRKPSHMYSIPNCVWPHSELIEYF